MPRIPSAHHDAVSIACIHTLSTSYFTSPRQPRPATHLRPLCHCVHCLSPQVAIALSIRDLRRCTSIEIPVVTSHLARYTRPAV